MSHNTLGDRSKRVPTTLLHSSLLHTIPISPIINRRLFKSKRQYCPLCHYSSPSLHVKSFHLPKLSSPITFYNRKQ